MDIHKYIDQNSEQMVKELVQLLRIPSVEGTPEEGAPFGKEVRSALDYTLSLCQRLGLKAVNVDGYAGYAEIEGVSGQEIGVLTHLDVVPAKDLENWELPPFDAKCRDGVIYARGICDDKGPAIASIYALAALKQSGIVPKRNIRLIFGCNEESGWGCIDYYSAKIGLPEVGFSPDADYPIINTEKGIYHGELKASAKCEDWSITVRGGDRPNVVVPQATAVIKGNIDRLSRTLLEYDAHQNGISFTAEGDTLSITAEGRAAHASTPHLGKNAFFALFDLLDKLDLGGEAGKHIRHINNALCFKSDGSGIGLAIKDDISGALTVNLGILDLKDGELTFTLDIRYPITASDSDIRTALKAAFPGFELRDGHVQQPHHTPEDHFLVKALKRVYERNTGKEATCIAIGGGTYARALKTGVAFGVTRPGAPELAHNANERMSITDLIEDTHMFADAYVELVSEE
ncbi:MAG: dipeptidase PepV [Clostridia bacterium]|nr:dipeptidase PepV [Clostridia bacterium]